MSAIYKINVNGVGHNIEYSFAQNGLTQTENNKLNHWINNNSYLASNTITISALYNNLKSNDLSNVYPGTIVTANLFAEGVSIILRDGKTSVTLPAGQHSFVVAAVNMSSPYLENTNVVTLIPAERSCMVAAPWATIASGSSETETDLPVVADDAMYIQRQWAYALRSYSDLYGAANNPFRCFCATGSWAGTDGYVNHTYGTCLQNIGGRYNGSTPQSFATIRNIFGTSAYSINPYADYCTLENSVQWPLMKLLGPSYFFKTYYNFGASDFIWCREVATTTQHCVVGASQNTMQQGVAYHSCSTSDYHMPVVYIGGTYA